MNKLTIEDIELLRAQIKWIESKKCKIPTKYKPLLVKSLIGALPYLVSSHKEKKK